MLIVVSCQVDIVFFVLMIRRPPRSTLDRSSAASDVYKRQVLAFDAGSGGDVTHSLPITAIERKGNPNLFTIIPVSYTHLRAHETVLDLVCRLLLEKKKHKKH